MVEAKMPWLRGRELKVQQDGARPHTGTDTVEELQEGGTGDGWVPVAVAQPPNSPTSVPTILASFRRLSMRSVRLALTALVV